MVDAPPFRRSIDERELLGPSGLRLDVDARRAYVRSQELPLTKQSFDLLSYLLMHAGRVVPNEELIRAVWAHEVVDDVHFLLTAIYRLRASLRGAGIADPIEVVRGVGYRIERGDTESARLHSAEALEAAIRATYVPTLLLDRAGRVVVANEAVAQRLGYPTAELERLPSVAVLTPRELRKARTTMFREVLRGQAIHFADSAMEHRDGSTIRFDVAVQPVRVDGRVIGAVFELWSPRDAPPRGESDDRLAGAAAANRASRLPTLVVDANQRILIANEGMAEVTGYSVGELEALPSAEVLTPPEARVRRAQDLAAILDDDAEEGWSEPILRRDGSVATAELVAVPFVVDGEVIGVLVQAWPRPDAWALLERESTEAGVEG